MDEDEAALLAELRAISNQSAASRFDAEEDVTSVDKDDPLPNSTFVGGSSNNVSFHKDDDKVEKSIQEEKKATTPEKVQDENASSSRSAGRRAAGIVPPWKRKRQAQSSTSTSNKDAINIEVVVASPPKTQPPPAVSHESVPTTTVPLTETAPVETDQSKGAAGDFRLSSTYQGARGGDAHDEELLALLKGVSAKSSGPDRFDDGENGNAAKPEEKAMQTPKSPPKPRVTSERQQSRNPTILPPWKRGKNKPKAENEFGDVDIAVAAPSSPTKQVSRAADEIVLTSDQTPTFVDAEDGVDKEALVGGGGNFRQESTFQGDRGGDANDAELLALLRGVSAKFNATDRFANEDGDAFGTKIEPAEADAAQNFQKQLPPWKRKQTAKSSIATRTKEVVASKPETSPTLSGNTAEDAPIVTEGALLGGGGNFKQESTFHGERGGSANDPELLALLRGVSAHSGGVDRFAEAPNGPAGPAPTIATTNKTPEDTAQHTPRTPSSAGVPPNTLGKQVAPAAFPSGLAPFPEEGAEEEIIVTKDELPGAFSDSNWKVRKEAYHVLQKTISDAATQTKIGILDANSILGGLDDMIPKLLTEKNAVALEFAMEASTTYADACSGGSSAECAKSIMNALFKGNGFTSPRPSSAKVVSALIIKLIEVGSSQESTDIVINSLVNQGLTSKKPKVVQLSVSLILEAAQSFGAASLPLAAVVAALPKVLSHSNKKIRDCGIEILAEFCRALGSKAPMEDVIGKMQKSQNKDLDILLEKQPGPSPVIVGLRRNRTSVGEEKPSTSASDALAALQAGGAELARERYASREAVNLIEELQTTEYESKLKLAKWSEKVAALDIALKCGGEEPFKLAQPSASTNYAPLISQMKGLLTHTHFAVVSKAMAVLAMLSQGVGEKLYPNLRPILPKLLQLSKDKKLTKGVSSCLDTFFGNLLGFDHLLQSEAALPEAADEGKEKNALARTMALQFLERCVSRGMSAGPRADLSAVAAKHCADFASEKLNDSDANVRKAALSVLDSLQKLDDQKIQPIVAIAIEELQRSNPRAYKTLSKSSPPKVAAAGDSLKQKASIPKDTSPSLSNGTSRKPLPRASAFDVPEPSKKDPPLTTSTSVRSAGSEPKPSNATSAPVSEEVVYRCASMGIPLWDEPNEEEGGVLVCLRSAKWQSRQSAIKSLAKFVTSQPLQDSCREIQHDTESLLSIVKDCTKDFKESNMNVTRSILDLFISLCEYHEKADCPFPAWAASDGVTLAIEKIADRKLSSLSKTLLASICVVRPANEMLPIVFTTVEALRAPAAHEESLLWLKSFCNDFGAHSMGSATNGAVTFLKTECSSKNVKVKRAATGVLGVMHSQLGPGFKAVVVAAFKDSLRDDAEKCLQENPHDISFRQTAWSRVCIDSLATNNATSDGASTLEIPKLDLVSELPSDCLSRMGSMDGKTAWKARKAAMEELENVLQNSSGVIDTSRTRPLIDLLRGLRDRLADSQSNLKPLAARLIGRILGSMEGEAQGKCGKVVYAPLISAAMNDNRKIMNDAAMEALEKGTSLPSVEGSGLNAASLEGFVVALTTELEGSEYKASGISDVLSLAEGFTKYLPDLDNVSSQRGETLGGRFASVLVDALLSPKTEIRASSESLLSLCLTDGVLSKQTVRKCVARLVPAKQRSVSIVLAKIMSSSGEERPNAPISSRREESIEETHSKASFGRTEKNSKTTSTVKQSIGLRKPSSAPKTSETPTRRNESLRDDGIISSSNPLFYEAGPFGSQKSRAAMRSLTWPEYPEEPSGSSLFSGLRKAWAPLVPPESIKALFPDGGIRKQDDAIGGFDILETSIDMERAGHGMVIAEQLGFILRWSVFVMSCKESTVGLTGLLSMLSKLTLHLRSLKYEFSDGETMLFVPFLFEKASISKGRFKEKYDDLVHLLKAGQVISNKKLGPLVCVAIMESSSHAKARLMACQDCYESVASQGLSGIGKKGVLVTAKSLSDEKLPENKSAFLDLMVLLVSRMNNDSQRLSKICGSSLSNKARSLVEERMKKVEKEGGLPSPTRTVGNQSRQEDSPSKATTFTRSVQRTPTSKMTSTREPIPTLTTNTRITDGSLTFQDELPALDLRLDARTSASNLPLSSPARISEWKQPSPPSSLPRLKLAEKPYLTQSRRKSPVSGSMVSLSKESSESISTNLFPSSSSSLSESSLKIKGNVFQNNEGGTCNETIGAAASLRARLMKIREKNHGSSSSQGFEVSLSKSASSGNPVEEASSGFQQSVSEEFTAALPVLSDCMSSLKELIEKPFPLQEDDSDLVACTDVLKNIHAAVSKQANLAVNVDAANITKLREDIRERISEVVAILTHLIGIGFHCHDLTFNAGMSVPLLSVNLASLMAIFRSQDLATLVSVDDLTILIKEAGKALLDQRLSAPSKSPDVSQLDEATSTQMVRAINKLAVQAATGATRSNAILALMKLQEQLSLSSEAGDDQLFISRLSRVVTKLLSRVIKSEESTANPYDAVSFDMEAVICCLDDTLEAGNRSEKVGNADGPAATRSLAKLLLASVLKVRGEMGTLMLTLKELEIDPGSSSLGGLIAACASDVGISSTETSSAPDIADLVSAVANSTEGSDRNRAVLNLKQYKESRGDSDLNNHLANVSGAFREFILEQLTENAAPAPPKTSNESMSERIKTLRSKLNATEAVIQSTVSNPIGVDGESGTVSIAYLASSSQSVSSKEDSSQTSLQAFRDRLAAANEKRSTNADVSSDAVQTSSSGNDTSAGSRAAALRARLQAVKMQSNLNDGKH